MNFSSRLVAAVVLSSGFIAAHSAEAAAPTRIGSETTLELPAAAEYSGLINFRPGNNEVVKLNPPRFTWSYTPDPKDLEKDIDAKSFVFMVAYDPAFAQIAVNVKTPLNFYNFIAPFTGTNCYWKVGYVRAGETVPYTWSAVRKFTIAPGATVWDRSVLADETYLASKGAHPHIFFNAGNREALYAFLQKRESEVTQKTSPVTEIDTGRGWTDAKKKAFSTITNSWWPATKPASAVVYEGNWAYYIANVAFVWQLTRDERLKNSEPQRALVELARYYTAYNGTISDNIIKQQMTEVLQCLAFGYDWLYEIMTEAQRAEVLRALELRCRFVTQGMMLWYDPKDAKYSYRQGDTNGIYPGTLYVRSTAHNKVGNSHNAFNFDWSMVAAYAAYNESPACRALLDYGLNYMIGKAYCYGEGGPNQGRTYSFQGLFEKTALYSQILGHSVFPEAKLNLNPYWNEAADIWSRVVPVGFYAGQEAWGDVGWGSVGHFWEKNTFGRNLSLFTKNGVAYKHWTEQIGLNIYAVYRPADDFYQLPIPFVCGAPPAPQLNSVLGRVYPIDGWAVGSSHPSNTRDCFTNGVGFIFQARPRGSETGHSHFSDLSFQMWAYASTITDAGAGMSAYAKIPYSHYSLLVDGLGPVNPYGPTTAAYSRFIAFRETPNYTYVAADGTDAYPRTKFTPDGWLMPKKFISLNTNAPLAHVQKVRRHILFVKKKYFVVYDEFEASKPSKFTWLYHVMENTLQMNAAEGKFKYTANTLKAVNAQNINFPKEVTVSVAHVGDPQKLQFLDLTGTNVCSNPITGEDYYKEADSKFRAHALWVSNKDPQTKFHFMTVIYPTKFGTSTPTINRLDDYTVEVINGTERDVISFDGATTKEPTILVDLTKPGSRPDAPQNVRIVGQ